VPGDLAVAELEELPLAPDAPPVDLALELDRQPGRKLLDAPAQQPPRRRPPRGELGDDRVRPGQLDAPSGDRRVEQRVGGIEAAERREVRGLEAGVERVGDDGAIVIRARPRFLRPRNGDLTSR
jgi:hypothetical protein